MAKLSFIFNSNSMKLIAIVCVVTALAVLTVSGNDAPNQISVSAEDFYSKYPAPKLHPLQDQQVVKSGETWKIRCSGRFPLEWVFPPTDKWQGDPNMTDRITIENEIIPGDNPRPFVSNLELKDVIYLGPIK